MGQLDRDDRTFRRIGLLLAFGRLKRGMALKRIGITSAVVLAILLAGCSASSGPPTTAIAPSPQADEAMTDVSGDSWPELPEGVLATGTFEGAAQGSVKLLNNGDGMLTVRVESFAIDLDRYSGVTAVPYPTYPDQRCGSRSVAWAFGYEQEGVVPEIYESRVPLDGFAGDPSLIRELIIRDFDAPDGFDECAAVPAARAPLDWSYEPLRAGLVGVDTGATGGARGEPKLQDDIVVGYTVAADDLVEEVAARFQLTADDVRYLNPELGPKLRTGETIIVNGSCR